MAGSKIKSEAVTTQVVSPVEASVSGQTSQVNSSVASVPKKGGFGCGKCFLVSCAVLLVCCCVTVICALVAPNIMVKTVMGGNKPADTSLTRINTLSELDTLVGDTIDMESFMTADPSTGLPTLILTEKEAIAFIYNNLGLNNGEKKMNEADISKLGIQFTPGNAKLQLDISLIFSSIPASEQQYIDPKIFEGVNISVDLGVSSDGSSIVLKDFSTGNTLIDSMITADMKEQFIKNFEDNLAENSSQTNGESPFRKIKINQGSIELTFSQADAF